TPPPPISPRRGTQRVRDRNPPEPMQHVDLRGLLGRLGQAVCVAVGLEEPVFGRSLDPQPGGRQAVSGQLYVGFSHYKIDIMAWLGPAGYPEGIATAKRKGDAVGFQG